MLEDKFRKKLLSWYDQNKRDLPFRRTKDPYKIWLSEIMLQQTTMSAVLPYYERFVKKHPTVESVAKTKEQNLLTLWQGLGYYSRIRHFQKACQQILREFSGKVPRTYKELKSLQGIGDYTAAAISSICFDEPHAVVDGNVKRVLSRIFDYQVDIKSKEADEFFKKTTKNLLNLERPGDHNQAMMELGATICRPKKPLCLLCPVQKLCLAQKSNPEALPIKSKTNFIDVTYHSLIIQADHKLLLRKPAEKNLIKNMWELPSLYDVKKSSWQKLVSPKIQAKKLQKVGKIKHSITNKKITTLVYEHPKIELKKSDFVYVEIKALDQLAINTLSRKIIKNHFKNID